MTSAGMAERLLRRDKAVLIAAIGVLFMLTGLYTAYGIGMNMTALRMTAMRAMRDMPGASAPGDWTAVYAILIFLMWWVMMIAMMLPSVSPTVLLYSALLRQGGSKDGIPQIAMVFLGGYLTVWAVFSAIAASTQWALEATGYVSATMMTLIDTVPGALVLILAGLFQFTPLKGACLRHCRAPAEFITRRRRPGATGAFVMGLEHGAYCLGCCWFLMALLFVGGIMNLFWIVGIAAFVAVEKLTPFGGTLAKLAGAALVLWGGYILVGSV
ncbi:DUF2182 domain-containing protein [Defluviimonas sp. WL0002]|uniref:DUF2182 domain-containing protein n=1 Tax=Albidovulum marisflavi TaxID=2984159 RepID=A0ABT2ZBG8_9RHOB|nr:DUF2182 domain-containing protein [Defluviimonas sp. WL0002]MCV2868459.1 DUF2182 domain-containing protein [Defluviimonas sp. WL0002]